jgi:hypothetical protein
MNPEYVVGRHQRPYPTFLSLKLFFRLSVQLLGNLQLVMVEGSYLYRLATYLISHHSQIKSTQVDHVRRTNATSVHDLHLSSLRPNTI